VSWSHAAAVALGVFVIVGAAICFWPRKRNRRVRPARPDVLVDYSAARAKAIAWLGDRYLLAKPINRTYQPQLLAMLKRQAS